MLPTILGGLSPNTFLHEYWQRKPLLIRSVIEPGHAASLIDGATLAGLACEDDADTRVVIKDPADASLTCDFGPFEEDYFTGLPADGWTLLVQAVDRYLDAIADLRNLVDFLPAWRLDDIMVSYAADGGGVGPHFDYYDVFLLQTRGRRLWRIGQPCDAQTPLADHPELKLLGEFTTAEEFVLEPGDALYVPPGVAHWGIAQGDDCVTCSVGFRAPSQAELFREAMEVLCEQLPDDHRFKDDVEQPGRGMEIGPGAVAEIARLWSAVPTSQWEQALVEAFGRLMTEPRDIHAGAALADIEPVEWVRLSPDARIARYEGDGTTLFIDGTGYQVSAELANAICNGEALEAGSWGEEDTVVIQCLLEAAALTQVD